VHKVSADHRLLVIHIDGKNYLVIVGSDAEVEEWITANAGATFVVDIGNARLMRTQVNVPPSDTETVMTTENKPFSDRVAEDLDRAEIPKVELEKIASIDEDTSPEEREEALLEIADPDLRSMLRDVIELARTGREDAARARVKLYSGEAVPLQEAPELHEAALQSVENSDVIVDLSTTDEAEFLRIMEAVDDERWMWFLHPGQERIVVENFDNPCVLTGVSGSGKTSVLLHRARRLAAKHQDQEILVLTLYLCFDFIT
jgi:primosomal protein N'